MEALPLVDVEAAGSGLVWCPGKGSVGARNETSLPNRLSEPEDSGLVAVEAKKREHHARHARTHTRKREDRTGRVSRNKPSAS